MTLDRSSLQNISLTKHGPGWSRVGHRRSLPKVEILSLLYLGKAVEGVRDIFGDANFNKFCRQHLLHPIPGQVRQTEGQVSCEVYNSWDWKIKLVYYFKVGKHDAGDLGEQKGAARLCRSGNQGQIWLQWFLIMMRPLNLIEYWKSVSWYETDRRRFGSELPPPVIKSTKVNCSK